MTCVFGAPEGVTITQACVELNWARGNHFPDSETGKPNRGMFGHVVESVEIKY